jgi:site-specific DNA-cytosine methylase
VFLVCGPTAIRWPEPTHADPDTLRQGSMFGPKLQPWRTVRQALNLDLLAGTRNVAQFSRVLLPDAPADSIQAGSPTSDHAPLVRVTGGGSNPHGKDASHERTYRDMTDEPSTTVAAEQIGNAGPFVLDLPMPTMSAGGHANGRSAVSANAHTRRMFDAAGIRRLTVMECATLQDFPPDHPWQGTQTSRYRQVGNAVPPSLARVVGGAVAEAIVRANVEGRELPRDSRSVLGCNVALDAVTPPL